METTWVCCGCKEPIAGSPHFADYDRDDGDGVAFFCDRCWGYRQAVRLLEDVVDCFARDECGYPPDECQPCRLIEKMRRVLEVCA